MKQRDIDYRNSMVAFLSTMQFTHLATLAFNREVTRDAALSFLSSLHQRVDRALYGRNYYKHDQDRRTTFAAFFEHPDTNQHWHVLWRVPQRTLLRGGKLINANPLFFWTCLREWRFLTKSGSAWLTPMQYEKGALRYAVKDLRADSSPEDFVFSGWLREGSRWPVNTDARVRP